MAVTTVIFDMDGVLVDTVEWHFRTWEKLMAEEGMAITREQNEVLRGLSRRDSLEILFQGRELDEERVKQLLQRKNEYYLQAIEHISREDLAPGAERLVNELKAMGIRVAVASSSQNTRVVLGQLGIADWFEVIIDGHCVKKAKPAPDLFLKAAGSLGVAPSECVVIEDAAAGVEAARRAGMKVVGIGPAVVGSDADRCYGSLDELSAAELLAV